MNERFQTSRRDAILRLKHLRDVTEAKADDMQNERQRFDRIAGAEPTRAISAFNLFQTPPDICTDIIGAVVSEIGVTAGLRWLEPSAGLGRIYRAIRSHDHLAETVLVENNPDCAGELFRAIAGDGNAQLLQRDFLACDRDRLGGGFDIVAMNPPFKFGRDVKHIRHALTLLNPGGVLVSLCYAGVKQRAAFEHADGVKWRLLPSGSFQTEGTRADVAMVVIRR